MPNITNAEYAQLKDYERRYRDKLDDETLKEFCEHFMKNFMLYVNYTRMDEWPEICKTIYRQTAEGRPTAAAIYRERNNLNVKTKL